jgi:hypothetical protein
MNPLHQANPTHTAICVVTCKTTGGIISMSQHEVRVTPKFILLGAYRFSRETGLEIRRSLGYGYASAYIQAIKLNSLKPIK